MILGSLSNSLSSLNRFSTLSSLLNMNGVKYLVFEFVYLGKVFWFEQMLLLWIKRLVRKLIGEKIFGMIEYHRYPQLRANWEGAFNNQTQRQRLYSDLLQAFDFIASVETGTYRGSTTEYLHKISGRKVYTVESNPHLFGFAKAKLRKYKDIVVECDDSRQFLKRLLKKKSFPEQGLFFYLDAHWKDDLPLKEEIELIFSQRQDSIVMIDDFQVPGDPGYFYDNYGDALGLTLKYLDSMPHLKIAKFFPAAISQNETGAKRGCVVLAVQERNIKRLESLPSLIKYSEAAPQ